MKLKFNVTGMTCAACSARVEKVTRAVSGVQKAEVNLLAGTMQVETENPEIASHIIRAVQKAGYGASVPGEQKTAGKEEKKPAAQTNGRRRTNVSYEKKEETVAEEPAAKLPKYNVVSK